VSITVTLFLVLLSAISDTSPSSLQFDLSSLRYLRTSLLSPLVLVYLLVWLVMLRVRASCCPISFSLLCSLTQICSLHLPHRWMTRLLQTFLFVSNFTHRHFTSLPLVYSILPPYLPRVLSKPGGAPPAFRSSSHPLRPSARILSRQ